MFTNLLTRRVNMIRLICIACLFVGACVSTPDKPTTGDYIPTKSDKMGAVIVGMEESISAGSCLGSYKDAMVMQEIMEYYTDNIVVLTNTNATKAAVVSALTDAIAKYEFVVFYYSGHGGSQRLSTTGDEEDDGKDEFMCLYDKYFVDNEVWDIISKSNGRVFLMFDACHSKTMFRAPGFTLKKQARKLQSSWFNRSSFSMLCWSGCADDKLSYGSAAGGMFTRTLYEHLTFSISYRDLWKKISDDEWLLSSEVPQQTVIGSWDLDAKVFQ